MEHWSQKMVDVDGDPQPQRTGAIQTLTLLIKLTVSPIDKMPSPDRHALDSDGAS
jgi:hypothetical protein